MDVYFLTVLEAGNQSKVPAHQVPDESALLGLLMAPFLLRPHMVERMETPSRCFHTGSNPITSGPCLI